MINSIKIKNVATYSSETETYKNLKNEFYDIKEKIIKFKNNTSIYLKEHSDIIKDSVMILDINDFLDTIEEELEKKSSDLKYVCNINKDISSIEKLHYLINSENEKIKQNNIKINDIENSKTKLISNGWDFIRNVSNKDVEKYNQKQITITHEISKILETKKQQEEKLDKVETEIHELENSITGITKSIMDGLYIVPDENLNQTAFRVFRQIFEELGHINHYKMMMQEDEES